MALRHSLSRIEASAELLLGRMGRGDLRSLESELQSILSNAKQIREILAGKNTPAERPENVAEAFLLKVDKIISEHISDPDFKIDTIVEAMAVSRSSLYTRFKSISGSTIGAYIADKRLAIAKALLTNAGLSVSEIAEKLGFSTQRYFSTFFKERTGMSPSAYRSSITLNDHTTNV